MISPLLEPRTCPFCGSVNQQAVWTFESVQFFSDSPDKQDTDICTVQCRDCNFLFMNPVYTTDGFSMLFAEAGQSYGGSTDRYAERVDWINFHKGIVSSHEIVLDVGCYEGQFLRQFQTGCQRVGVDIDLPAIERARVADPGGKYIHADLNRFSWDGPPPSQILLNHVLEHVVDPIELLRHLRGISSRETSIFIEVPTLENDFPGDVCGFFSTQHLSHFTHSSLFATIHKAGLRVVAVEQMTDYNGVRVLATISPRKALTSASDWSLSSGSLAQHIERYTAVLAAIDAQLVDASGFEVVLWGVGLHSSLLHSAVPTFRSLKIVRQVDSDPQKIGSRWKRQLVEHPKILGELDWKRTRLLLSSYGAQREMSRAAQDLGVPKSAIIELYSEVRT